MKEKQIEAIDVDKAWDTLYNRLQADGLLQQDNNLQRKAVKHPRRLIMQWAAAVVALFAVGLTTMYLLSREGNVPLLSFKNVDASTTLVKTLEDGSTIFLKGNTTLLVPEKFEVNQRVVSFTGDALFSVAKDAQRPFIVEAEGAVVEVLGTTFRISSSTSGKFELSVEEGTVRVSKKNGNEQAIVKAGEMLVIQDGKLLKTQHRDSLTFSHQMERLCFEDEKLEDIIRVANSISTQQVVLADEQLGSKTLTVTFDGSTANAVADLVCLALNLKQTTRQGVIYISQ